MTTTTPAALTIDTPEFRELMCNLGYWADEDEGERDDCAIRLIAHIDAKLTAASPAVPTYTCKGKGGAYELIGVAKGAGMVRDSMAMQVYRDTSTRQLYFRTMSDFADRMELIVNPAAQEPAPATQQGDEPVGRLYYERVNGDWGIVGVDPDDPRLKDGASLYLAATQQGEPKAPHLEPVGRVKDHFAGTDKAYRTVVWADRTFAMDVPDAAHLYAAPITQQAEPVAWAVEWPNKMIDFVRDPREDMFEHWESCGAVVRPLIYGIAAPLSASPASAPKASGATGFDFHAHLARQAAWSERTFGPGPRTAGVCDHIRKELLEIEADPTDLREWVDVVILALDGAWRCGGTPDQIISGIVAKQTKNEGRNWPDWRTADPNKAIEHDRSGELASPAATEASGAAVPDVDATPEQIATWRSMRGHVLTDVINGNDITLPRCYGDDMLALFDVALPRVPDEDEEDAAAPAAPEQTEKP